MNQIVPTHALLCPTLAESSGARSALSDATMLQDIGHQFDDGDEGLTNIGVDAATLVGPQAPAEDAVTLHRFGDLTKDTRTETSGLCPSRRHSERSSHAF